MMGISLKAKEKGGLEDRPNRILRFYFQATRTFSGCQPLGPLTTSNWTACPS